MTVRNSHQWSFHQRKTLVHAHDFVPLHARLSITSMHRNFMVQVIISVPPLP